MKYIMFKNSLGQLMPFIFPSSMPHVLMAEAVQAALPDLTLVPVSAGDYNPLDGSTSGFSSTLSLTSKVTDSNVIRMYPYLHGL